MNNECVATGMTCLFGPYGEHGENQCKFCGDVPEPSGVVVERCRVWIKAGGQMFMMAFEGESDHERSWYAKQLSDAISTFTHGVKT